ncbi:unnamed protein product [Thelazia callipaeda]|uniref:LisH domain-containing protein n=1 Tax=Thelazia callipaeda TaxID=103827 RepID=A0A0N5DB09_THECL|nr:unnamed protein product [Thelazia callipaeda]
MVGRGMVKKRPKQSHDMTLRETSLTPISLPTTTSTPLPSTLMDTSTSPLSSVRDLDADLSEIDILIQRYLANTQYKTAVFWADKRLALCRKSGFKVSFIDVAHFIKVYRFYVW